MCEPGPLVRSVAVLLLAVTFVAAYHPESDERPVKFRPISTFPPVDVPYEPREVMYSLERLHQVLGILLAALVILIVSGSKASGGAVLNAVYILVLKLGPDVRGC